MEYFENSSSYSFKKSTSASSMRYGNLSENSFRNSPRNSDRCFHSNIFMNFFWDSSKKSLSPPEIMYNYFHWLFEVFYHQFLMDVLHGSFNQFQFQNIAQIAWENSREICSEDSKEIFPGIYTGFFFLSVS